MYRKPSKVKYYTTFETEADRERYIEEFKIFIAIQSTLSKETQNDYKRLCFAVHPSALAIDDRAKMDDNFQHSIELMEYSKVEDTPRFRMHFLVFIGTVYHGVKDLALAMKDDPKFNWKIAESLLQDFEKTWNEHQYLLHSEHPELLDIMKEEEEEGEKKACS